MAQVVKKQTETKKKKPAVSALKKTAAKKPQQTGERKRKVAKYTSFKLQKKIPHPKGSLPTARVILSKAFRLCWAAKKPLLGVIIVYGLLHFVFVRGFASPLNVTEIKDTLAEAFGEELTGLTGAGAVFSVLLSGNGATGSETASVYQTILFIMVSLACIWVFRQYAVGKKTTAREAYYLGMYPLVPFLLVLLTFFLQMIPAYIGSLIYQIVQTNGLAVSGVEQAIWLILFGSLALLSLYMICSSLFALYVVTLPDMRPMQALRSSRQLVFSRRLSVFRKLLIIPVIAFALLILILIPTIYFLPFAAPWLYMVLSLMSIVFLHAYLFSLYKELL
jgi:hypothetical protein